MSLFNERDQLYAYHPKEPIFWRNEAIYFCAFSLIGHWMEIVYCLFMDLAFGIVEDDSLVWEDPFYPFLVYGFGTLVCALFLIPLKFRVISRRKTLWGALLLFYVITVFVCMVMELGMGLMLNQPDMYGEYPLWDNSELPGNIFGQAWIVNDLLLGLVATVYTWTIHPTCQKFLSRFPKQGMDIFAVIAVVAFIVLCGIKFAPEIIVI